MRSAPMLLAISLVLTLSATLWAGPTVQVLATCKPPGSSRPSGILELVTSSDGTARQYLLELRGTHYQMGYAHGFLLAESIARYYHDYFRGAYLPPEKATQLKAGAIFSLLPRKYQDELRGMAEGIRDRAKELTAEGKPAPRPVGRDELLQMQCEVELAGFGCTAVASWGSRTAGGPLAGATVISRSADWVDAHPERLFSGLQGTISYVSSEPGEAALVANSRAGLIGVHTGLNATGFFIEMNYAPITPIRAGSFYPSLLYQRDALEAVDGAGKDLAGIKSQLDPILARSDVIPTIQPMIGWVSREPTGGVAVIEGIGTPGGATYRTVGWDRANQPGPDGIPRIRLAWATKQHPGGADTVLVTDGSFLGECSESPAGSGKYLVADKVTNAKLFEFESADIVASRAKPELWLSAKCRGVGGRYAGKTWWLDNASRGHYGAREEIHGFIGLGRFPPARFLGVCAFAVDHAGKMSNKGFWISADPADPACGVAVLESSGTRTVDGVSLEAGKLRFASTAASSTWGTGSYVRYGDIALFGDYNDDSGSPAGSWFCYGNPGPKDLLVNVNSWFLPWTVPFTTKQDDCLGGLHGAYRLHRAYADFAGRADFTLASHHDRFTQMYRDHIVFGASDTMSPAGSICTASFVPSSRRIRISYSTLVEKSGSGTAESPMTAYAATSTRVTPIEYAWDDFFSGDRALAAAPPSVTATASAPAPAPTPAAPSGTGGASNPTMGQP